MTNTNLRVWYERNTLTEISEWPSNSVSITDWGPKFATGDTGKDWADFFEEEKTLLREHVIEVDGLSNIGVSGISRTVFSPDWDKYLALKLPLGSRFLPDDINLAEFGLGGSPAPVELGLGP